MSIGSVYVHVCVHIYMYIYEEKKISCLLKGTFMFYSCLQMVSWWFHSELWKLLDVEKLRVIKYTEIFNNWIIKHIMQLSRIQCCDVMCIGGVKNPKFACEAAGVGWIIATKEWGLRIVLVRLLLAQCSWEIGEKKQVIRKGTDIRM